MPKKSYAEKLRDPRWQKKRLEVLNYFGFQCAKCDSTDKPLHVHHRWYSSNREPWEYPESCFLSLCEDCHSREGLNDDGTYHFEEWEILLDSLFDTREVYYDGISLAFEIEERLKQGFHRPEIRRAIEMYLASDRFAEDCATYRAERAARAASGKQLDPNDYPEAFG